MLTGRDWISLLLTWAAGSMDAVSYLGLDHVLTANMTGNTVLLSLAIGQGNALQASRPFTALIGFITGAAIGAAVAKPQRKGEDWPPSVTAALLVEGGVVAIFAARLVRKRPRRHAVYPLLFDSAIRYRYGNAKRRCKAASHSRRGNHVYYRNHHRRHIGIGNWRASRCSHGSGAERRCATKTGGRLGASDRTAGRRIYRLRSRRNRHSCH